MDVSSIASAASGNAMAQIQDKAATLVLRKALDAQEQSAMALLQAIPAPQPVPTGMAGGVIDTWA